MTNRFFVLMNETHRHQAILTAIALSIFFCLGCGSKVPYDLAPVSGMVTLDGKPLTGGKVMFAPIAQGASAKAGKPGFGKLNADGTYVISTYGSEDGAVVGKHWVSIMRNLQVAGPDQPAEEASSMPFEQFAVPEQKTVVAGEENKIDIALTSAMLSE